jgi:ATP-dependent Clp protease ATP-binding subunit ClpB
VLFDEIEKAHHDVFNVMLQILDDGRLTDGQGRTVDFKNTVLIMTSNVGSQRILEFQGAPGSPGYERIKAAVLDELSHQFRPEFLNRVDDMVVFHSLTADDLFKIINIQIAGMQKRLLERHIELELSPEAKQHLVKVGYDPAYGARPLKRALQKEVTTRIAKALLAGQIHDGQKVSVDFDDRHGEIVIREASVEAVRS